MNRLCFRVVLRWLGACFELIRSRPVLHRLYIKNRVLIELLSAYVASSEAKQAEKLRKLANATYGLASEQKQDVKPEQQKRPSILLKRKGLGL